MRIRRTCMHIRIWSSIKQVCQCKALVIRIEYDDYVKTFYFTFIVHLIGCSPTSSGIIIVDSTTEHCVSSRNYNQADGKGTFSHGDKCNWLLQVELVELCHVSACLFIWHSLLLARTLI